MTPPNPPSRAGENRSLARVACASDGTGASVPQPPRGTLAGTSPHSGGRAAAGSLDPVTGAAASSRGAAPGRGRAELPAGAPGGALAGSKPAGRAAYEAARRKAQARRPADPQRAPGRPGAPARVAEMMRPCATVLPGGGVCGATGYEHDTGTRAGAEVRTRCSIATGAGPCGCRVYVPQPETPDGAA